MNNPLKKIFKPKIKLAKGTRFVSFLFISVSVLIAGAVLFAANMYYNIDTGEVVLEEIYRVSGVVRATAGLIVGGTASQNPTAGYGFEVATSTLFSAGDVVLSQANQLLRFTGGTTGPEYYIGFRATTTISTSTTYTWPSSYGTAGQALITTADGVLSWNTPSGMGDITKIGDVIESEAFSTSTVAGTSLWFHNNGNMGQLTVGTLSSGQTYTLPDFTGTIALQGSGSLGTGGALFANSGLIATSSNFNWDNTNRRLSLGATSTANGIIRLYGGTGGFTEFQAVASGDDVTYTWPANDGDSNYVLTTDGSGILTWKTATGTAGAIDIQGSPQGGQVTFFYDSDTLMSTSTFTFSTSTAKLTLGGGLVANLIEYTGGDLELRTNTSGDILLNPASNIVQLATSTYIRTHGGYEIGVTGTQILVEMIPILGFDLPVQTATTSYIQISRTLEDYPFSTAATGTTRVHKLVFRYAASTTNPIDFRVYTNAEHSSSTLPVPQTANLDKGEAYIVTTTIPTDATAWRLDVKTTDVPDTVRIFQIFLAAYDEIQ